MLNGVHNMGINIRIKISNKNAIGRYARILPHIAKQILEDLAQAHMINIATEMSIGNHNTSTTTIKSLKSIPKSKNRIDIQGSQVFTYLNDGTRPHSIPNVSRTRNWAAAKIDSAPKYQFGAMKKAIEEKGTKPYFILDKATSQTQHDMKNIIQNRLNMKISAVVK